MSWNCRECGASEGQLHARHCPLSDAESRTRMLEPRRGLPMCDECGAATGHHGACLTGYAEQKAREREEVFQAVLLQARKYGEVNASNPDCPTCKMPWPTHTDACPRRSPRPGAVVEADFDADHGGGAVVCMAGWTSPVFRIAKGQSVSVDFTGPMKAALTDHLNGVKARAVAAVASVKHSSDASPPRKRVPDCGFKGCTAPVHTDSLNASPGIRPPRGYCLKHFCMWLGKERPIGPRITAVEAGPGKTLENYLAQRINKLAVDDMSEPP